MWACAFLFYKYLYGFGFGQATNIDLPGEAKGIVIDKAEIKPINIATMSMGQSIAVSPINCLWQYRLLLTTVCC